MAALTVGHVDSFDVVMEEFGNLPIQIARMLANAEVTIIANPLIWGGFKRLRPDARDASGRSRFTSVLAPPG
ncbi:hypothetical protein SNOUR_24045 [Streptomyces noursei ATCC 11455]|nr:hypothetical protein SNOUR_24045 [Streptomyces noursei ATCC 11455]